MGDEKATAAPVGPTAQPKKEKEPQGPLAMASMEMDDSDTALTLMPKFKTFGEIFEYCNWVATSSIVPEAYRNRPADIFVAAQYGADLGLRFMTAIQNIAIINGRPALPSDIKLAMVRSRKLLEKMTEATDEEIRQTGIAWCEMKRVGVDEPIRHAFSVEDAKAAGLWERRGSNNYPTPWVTFKWRMLSLKPRDMCLKDLFGDVFKGLHSVEEARDIQILESDQTPTAQIESKSQPDTKGKEILDVKQEELKPAETIEMSIGQTVGQTLKTEPAEPFKQPEPAASAQTQQEPQTSVPEKSEAAKAFADMVDTETDRMRTMPAGNSVLLRIWSSFKMPVAQFAKGKPSQILNDADLESFSLQIEKFLDPNASKK